MTGPPILPLLLRRRTPTSWWRISGRTTCRVWYAPKTAPLTAPRNGPRLIGRKRAVSCRLRRRKASFWYGCGLGRHMTLINPLFEAEANASGAIYLPLGTITSGEGGGFTKAIPINGENVTIRTGDGSHFNMTGYRLVADHILDTLDSRFRLMPGVDQLVVLQ